MMLTTYFLYDIQSILRVVMSQTELKMQPTIHWQRKPGYFSRPYPGLLCKGIVGCIFNSVGLIITREIPCIEIFKYWCFI
jgi:hypothetical protein